MRNGIKHPSLPLLLSATTAAFTPALVAADDTAALRQEIQSLESRLEQQIRSAAEWKSPNALIHMAGYADVGYTDGEGDSGSFRVGTFAPIFHYQYRDLVMLESELALTVTETGGTELDLEYLTADLFINDYMVLVLGKFLSPLGQFRQNLHPSWVNKLPSAPTGFGHDQAAPNADVGVQLRGGFPLEGLSANANYAVYVGNGPAFELNEEGDGIETIETPGSGFDGDGKKVLGGRLGLFFPATKLEIGLSAAAGKAAVWEIAGETVGYEPTRDYDVLGADFTWRPAGFDLRGEYIEQQVGASASSAAPASATFRAWYLQGAYRFLPTRWEAVLRYAEYDTPEGNNRQWTPGINYLWASNVVGKIAWEFNDRDGVDDDRLLIQLAYGF